MRHSSPPARRLTISCIGDSQTDGATAWTYCRPDQKWPEALVQKMRAAPYYLPIKARNYGISGDTSAQNLARSDVLQQWEIPDIAAIYVGVNDPGASISTSQTQANIQALIKCVKYGVVGIKSGIASNTNSVSGQANLPSNAPPLTRMVVMVDTSTTGGLNAVWPGQTVGISGVGGGSQTVWESRTPQAGESGWGRIAITGTPVFSGCCSRIIVISTNYLNYASGGGDNAGTSTYYAPYQTVRTAQSAAVAAENIGGATNVLYVDLFGFQASLIASGETTQGSNSWHWVASNQHHNAYGHDIIARAVLSGIINSRPAWLSEMAPL